MGRYGYPRTSQWKAAMLMNYYGPSGGVPNNALVQSVLDQATTDGAIKPSQSTISALNTFFESIDSVLSKAEMIKIGLLGSGDCLEFTKYNYVNPSLYKSTHAGTGPIIYSLKGWSSNGSSYINEGITMKRRPDLPTNSSSIVITDAYNNASVDQAACGCVSGQYYIMRPYLSGGGNYYFTGLTAIAPLLTTHNVFMSFSTNGASGTRARLRQNDTYGNISSNLTGVEMTNDLPVFTCAYNNAGSPLRWYTQGNIMFRWEGYELTDAELDIIKNAWDVYYASMVTTSFTSSATLTSDGREVWIIAADSKGGTSDAVGQRCNPNSVLQHNRATGNLQEVLGADLANIPSTGSPWPKFGRLFYESSANMWKKPVISNYAISGSCFINSFKSASWDQDDSGLVYASAKAVWDDALADVGVTKPAGVVVILGINDTNQAQPIATTEAEMDNLFDRLNTDYDTPNIYVSLTGRQTLPSEPALSRENAIRAKLNSIASLNSNITIFQDERVVFGDAANTNDGTHWNYAGNAVVAQNLFDGL